MCYSVVFHQEYTKGLQSNGKSISQAKGLISEYQPKYTSARAVYRERKKYVDEIDWNMLAVPPNGSAKVIFCIFV